MLLKKVRNAFRQTEAKIQGRTGFKTQRRLSGTIQIQENKDIDVCSIEVRPWRDFPAVKDAERISAKLAKGNEIIKFRDSLGLVLIDPWGKYWLHGSGDDYHKENNNPALWHTVSPEALKIMLSEGLDVKWKSPSAGLPCIIYRTTGKSILTFMFGTPDTIKFLLNNRADINTITF